MSFHKPCHMPFRKLILPFTLTAGKRTMRPFFYHTDLGQNLFFFALFKPIILQFFTILQENLHSISTTIKERASFAPQIIALNYKTFS